MAVLKSLAIVTMPRSVVDPVQTRRIKLVGRLEEQLQLLQNPDLVRKQQRWVTKDGEKQLVSKDQRVRPWWKTDAAGHLYLVVRYGGKPLEFEKGKAAIAVPAKDKLSSVIETLIAAVRGGELDEILGSASKARPFPKKRKAA